MPNLLSIFSISKVVFNFMMLVLLHFLDLLASELSPSFIFIKSIKHWRLVYILDLIFSFFDSLLWIESFSLMNLGRFFIFSSIFILIGFSTMTCPLCNLLSSLYLISISVVLDYKSIRSNVMLPITLISLIPFWLITGWTISIFTWRCLQNTICFNTCVGWMISSSIILIQIIPFPTRASPPTRCLGVTIDTDSTRTTARVLYIRWEFWESLSLSDWLRVLTLSMIFTFIWISASISKGFSMFSSIHGFRFQRGFNIITRWGPCIKICHDTC